jgi:hypothetical protein
MAYDRIDDDAFNMDHDDGIKKLIAQNELASFRITSTRQTKYL